MNKPGVGKLVSETGLSKEVSRLNDLLLIVECRGGKNLYHFSFLFLYFQVYWETL